MTVATRRGTDLVRESSMPVGISFRASSKHSTILLFLINKRSKVRKLMVQNPRKVVLGMLNGIKIGRTSWMID